MSRISYENSNNNFTTNSFIGTAIDVGGYNYISVICKTGVDATLYVYQSYDGISYETTNTKNIASQDTLYQSFLLFMKYLRIEIIGTGTMNGLIMTKLHASQVTSTTTSSSTDAANKQEGTKVFGGDMGNAILCRNIGTDQYALPNVNFEGSLLTFDTGLDACINKVTNIAVIEAANTVATRDLAASNALTSVSNTLTSINNAVSTGNTSLQSINNSLSGTLSVSDSTSHTALTNIHSDLTGTLNVSDANAYTTLGILHNDLSGTLNVSDQSARTTLASIHSDLNSTLNVSDQTTHTALNQLHTDLSTLTVTQKLNTLGNAPDVTTVNLVGGINTVGGTVSVPLIENGSIHVSDATTQSAIGTAATNIITAVNNIHTQLLNTSGTLPTSGSINLIGGVDTVSNNVTTVKTDNTGVLYVNDTALQNGMNTLTSCVASSAVSVHNAILESAVNNSKLQTTIIGKNGSDITKNTGDTVVSYMPIAGVDSLNVLSPLVVGANGLKVQQVLGKSGEAPAIGSINAIGGTDISGNISVPLINSNRSFSVTDLAIDNYSTTGIKTLSVNDATSQSTLNTISTNISKVANTGVNVTNTTLVVSDEIAQSILDTMSTNILKVANTGVNVTNTTLAVSDSTSQSTLGTISTKISKVADTGVNITNTTLAVSDATSQSTLGTISTNISKLADTGVNITNTTLAVSDATSQSTLNTISTKISKVADTGVNITNTSVPVSDAASQGMLNIISTKTTNMADNGVNILGYNGSTYQPIITDTDGRIGVSDEYEYSVGDILFRSCGLDHYKSSLLNKYDTYISASASTINVGDNPLYNGSTLFYLGTAFLSHANNESAALSEMMLLSKEQFVIENDSYTSVDFDVNFNSTKVSGVYSSIGIGNAAEGIMFGYNDTGSISLFQQYNGSNNAVTFVLTPANITDIIGNVTNNAVSALINLNTDNNEYVLPMTDQNGYSMGVTTTNGVTTDQSFISRLVYAVNNSSSKPGAYTMSVAILGDGSYQLTLFSNLCNTGNTLTTKIVLAITAAVGGSGRRATFNPTINQLGVVPSTVNLSGNTIFPMAGSYKLIIKNRNRVILQSINPTTGKYNTLVNVTLTNPIQNDKWKFKSYIRITTNSTIHISMSWSNIVVKSSTKKQDSTLLPSSYMMPYINTGTNSIAAGNPRVNYLYYIIINSPYTPGSSLFTSSKIINSDKIILTKFNIGLYLTAHINVYLVKTKIGGRSIDEFNGIVDYIYSGYTIANKLLYGNSLITTYSTTYTYDNECMWSTSIYANNGDFITFDLSKYNYCIYPGESLYVLIGAPSGSRLQLQASIDTASNI